MEFDMQRAIESMDARLTLQLTQIHNDGRQDAADIKGLIAKHETLDTKRFGDIDTAMKAHSLQLNEFGLLKRALYFAIGALVLSAAGVAVEHAYNHAPTPAVVATPAVPDTTIGKRK